MKRIAVLFSLLLALLVPASAQLTMTGVGGGFGAAAGGAYTGPGNLSLTGTLVKYWGWSCVTSAYAGPAIDLVDTATGNTTGTRLMCVSGTLTALVSGSACTFVTGNACSALATTCATSCSVVTKYEQIGTADCGGATVCNLTQSNNALRPTRTTSGAGANQCEAYTSTQVLLTAGIGPSYAQPSSLAAISSRTGATTTLSNIISTNSSFVGLYHSATAANSQIYAGNLSANVAATDNAFHAFQVVFNAASSILAVDGSGTTVSPGASAMASDVIATGVSSGGPFTGVHCEAMIFTGTNSAGDNTTLNTNQHARFGF